MMRKQPKVVIVGAGIAGLACARLLQRENLDVEVFDKGFNVGGRVATRLASRTDASLYFDHGAQYFTAKSDQFKKQVDTWLDNNVIALWQGKVGSVNAAGPGKFEPEKNSHERFAGTPYMRSIAQDLALGLQVQTNRLVVAVQRQTIDKRWSIKFDDGEVATGYDAIVLALPPAQAAALLENCGDIANYDDYLLLQKKCKATAMAPCWATFASFETRLDIPFDGLFVEGSALSWICRDSSKPGRPPGERWVLHASPDWSQAHLEDQADAIQNYLLQEFLKVTGLFDRNINVDRSGFEPTFCRSHRWRYALQQDTEKKALLANKDQTLIVSGDWCQSGKVEGAFLSGREAAEGILSGLKSTPSL